MTETPRSALVRTVLFPSATSLLVALLVVDACLVVGHILHELWGVGPFSLIRWSLMEEGGFATLFGGCKLLGAAAIMWLMARRSGAPIDLGWAFALATAAMDDLLGLHEGLGALVVDWFRLPGPFGLDPLVLAELIVWAIIGSGATVLVVLTHVSSPPEAKRRSLRIAGLVALLAFFAVGVDGVNGFFLEGSAHVVLVLIEDGGELITISLILAYVASVILADTSAPDWSEQPKPEGSSAFGTNTLLGG